MDKLNDVTLVITSCKRLNLLETTINSFLKYNTYPIKQAIIIEDSGDLKIYQQLLSKYSNRFRIIFNTIPLKQLGSIDKAYNEVDTKYIFHCEDDWEFYRYGFIEDSIDILELDKRVKQVGLRSIQHDYIVNHPTIELDDNLLIIGNHNCYKFKMKDEFKEYDWVTCSFNPGLIRKCDYDLIGSYSSVAKSEGGVSLFYKNKGFYSVALENDAIKHIGWEESTMGHYQKKYSFIVRFKNLHKAILNIFGFNYDYN